MKADEFLSRASRELRDEGEAPPSEVAATRARIMATMRRDAHRPRRVAFWVMPIAAVLAASTALATNRVEIQKVWHRLLGSAPSVVQPLSVETSRTAPPASRNLNPTSEREVPPAASTIAEDPAPPTIAGVTVAPTTAAARSPSPKSAASSSARGPLTKAPTPTSTPTAAMTPEPKPEAPSVNTPSAEPSAESEALPLELYKRAHRLHFQQQKYGDAIVAWNDYLRAQPNGSLAVEARYNRAIALLRNGQRDEARGALAPFARGEIAGGYRAEEARSLLRAMEGIVR